MKVLADVCHTAKQPLLATRGTCDPFINVLRARSASTGEQPLPSSVTCHLRGASRRQSQTLQTAAVQEEAVAIETTARQVDVTEKQESLDTEYQDGAFEIEDVPTLPISHLDNKEAVERMQEAVHQHAKNHYHAFFSTELGGVVTDPAFMMIHMDDHLVHRGHGVFDTALVIDGQLYMLDRHIERLANSAMQAGLILPTSLAQIKRVIIETVAHSKKMSGFVRYWLGAGRGGFAISSQECINPSFYCMMTTLKEGSPTLNPGSDYLRGRTVKTSPIPAKHPYFAVVKSNNYLPNVLATLDAESENKDYGIFLDDFGNVAEGPTMNVAILTKDGEFVIPPFDQCLPGLTLIRLVELIEQNLGNLMEETQGALRYVTQRPFTKFEAYDCREAFLVGSTTYVTAIVQWDNKDIGEGATGDEPGVISLILRALLKRDMEPTEAPRENFTPVDYGILTNME